MLLELDTPFTSHGEHLEWLVASPRHAGVTIEEVERVGGIVNVARVRPGIELAVGARFASTDVERIITGYLRANPFDASVTKPHAGLV